jgi:hypothetical protein
VIGWARSTYWLLPLRFCRCTPVVLLCVSMGATSLSADDLICGASSSYQQTILTSLKDNCCRVTRSCRGAAGRPGRIVYDGDYCSTKSNSIDCSVTPTNTSLFVVELGKDILFAASPTLYQSPDYWFLDDHRENLDLITERKLPPKEYRLFGDKKNIAFIVLPYWGNRFYGVSTTASTDQSVVPTAIYDSGLVDHKNEVYQWVDNIISGRNPEHFQRFLINYKRFSNSENCEFKIENTLFAGEFHTAVLTAAGCVLVDTRWLEQKCKSDLQTSPDFHKDLGRYLADRLGWCSANE